MKITLKKSMVLLLLLCLVAVPLMSKEIAAVGVGDSIESARQNAKNNLSVRINGEYVSVSTFAGVAETNSALAASFEQSTNTVSSGFLYLVEFKDEAQDKKQYTSTAYIPDTSETQDYFVSMLDGLCVDINILHSGLDTAQDKKVALVELYGKLNQYESIRQLMTLMGHYDKVPSYGLFITSGSIFTEYQNIVISEGYSLQEAQREVSDAAQLSKIREQIAKNQAELAKLQAEKSAQTLAFEEASRKALEEKLAESLLRTSAMEVMMGSRNQDSNEALENILSLRTEFQQSCDTYNRMVSEELSLIDSQFGAEYKAIKNRPYRFSELDQNGEPLFMAVSSRNEEYDYLFESFLLRKAETYKVIHSSFFNPIYSRYKNFSSAVDAFSGNTYRRKLEEGTYSVSSVYDANAHLWLLTFVLEDTLGIDVPLTLELSYKELTGLEPVGIKKNYEVDYDDYVQFSSNIDYIQSLFNDFSHHFVTYVLVTGSVEKQSGIGFGKAQFTNITLELNSMAIESNPSLKLRLAASPSAIDVADLTMTFSSYAKVFESEFRSGALR